ncbi:MAG TPA: hypothetical protein VK742_18045 [Candidatus Sulfotelmatobacter sp.]|jgi:hypothetical protein|nr:hypothetical protein [Candidatus Sulfotelmatobacter sp.]
MKKLGFILPVVLGFLLLNNQPAIADVLDNWTTTIITNQFIVGADTLVEHIVNGNGVFVAYEEEGDSGVFYSSPDGINWTRRYTDNNSWGFNLSYSGGKFVGVGVLEYAISADGTNWNVQFVPSFGSEINPYYTGTASSGSRYVMVGDTNNVGAIITSSDGTNWVYHPATTNMNNGIMGNIQVVVTGGHISSVAFGASKFVAIGQNDGYEYFASGNLSTWTRTNILGGSSIYFANGFFLCR